MKKARGNAMSSLSSAGKSVVDPAEIPPE